MVDRAIFCPGANRGFFLEGGGGPSMTWLLGMNLLRVARASFLPLVDGGDRYCINYLGM